MLRLNVDVGGLRKEMGGAAANCCFVSRCHSTIVLLQWTYLTASKLFYIVGGNKRLNTIQCCLKIHQRETEHILPGISYIPEHYDTPLPAQLFLFFFFF